MKKIVLVLVMCAILCFSFVKKSQAYEGNNNLYVGNTINAAKATSVSDYKESVNIFNYDYRNHIRSHTFNKVGGSHMYPEKTFTIVKSSMNALQAAYSSKMKTSFSIGGKITPAFTANEKLGFSLETKAKYEKSVSDMYVMVQENYYDSIQYIEDYGYNYKIKEFADNLHFEYREDLASVANHRLGYEEFFNKYGTHLIVAAELGCSLNVVAKVRSYYKKIEIGIGGGLESETNIGVSGVGKLGYDISGSFLGSFGLTSQNSDVIISTQTNGGRPIVATNFIDDATINQWNEDARKNLAIIGYKGDENNDGTPDGLIPLYDLIPSDIKISKNEMQAAMLSYLMNNKTEIKSITEDSHYIVEPKKELHSTYIREKEYKINSNKINSNPHDLITFDLTYEGQKFDFFKNVYSSFTITLEIDRQYYEKGYKHYYIYNCNEDKSCNEEIYHTYQTGKNHSYVNEKIIFDEKIPIDKLTRTLCVKYKASGKGSDKWFNKNPKLIVTLYE